MRVCVCTLFLNRTVHIMRHVHMTSVIHVTNLQPRQFVRTCVSGMNRYRPPAVRRSCWRPPVADGGAAAVSSAEAPSPLCSAPTASRIAPSLTLMLAGLHAGLARKERTAWPYNIHVSHKHERHMRDSKADGSAVDAEKSRWDSPARDLRRGHRKREWRPSDWLSLIHI